MANSYAITPLWGSYYCDYVALGSYVEDSVQQVEFPMVSNIQNELFKHLFS